MTYLLLFLVVVFNVLGQVMLKRSSPDVSIFTLSSLLNSYLLTGVFLQILALFTWLYLLRFVPLFWLSVVLGCIIVLSTTASVVVFNDTISWAQIFGVMMVVFGIVLIAH